MIKFTCLILLLSIQGFQALYAQPKIQKELTYTSDLAFNLSGGHETGSAWLGCFQAALTFNTEELKLWNNGKFRFAYISTHGNSFSEMTGDMQIVSNIEAGHLATTLELWYQHNFNRLAMTAAFIDVNAFFSYNQDALSLINSSFGIQPTISGNMPVSIFPVTSFGVVMEYDFDENTSLKFAVFDGTRALYRDYQILPDINWNKTDGAFLISEFSRKYRISHQTGIVKGGIWAHSQNTKSHQNGTYALNWGYYLIGDLQVYKSERTRWSIWGKSGGAPLDCNKIRYFNELGVSLVNDSEKNIVDIISIGIGQAIFCPEFKKINAFQHNEAVIEFTAKKEIGILGIQPDIQYIFHPSGSSVVQNPLCIILRTTLTL